MLELLFLGVLRELVRCNTRVIKVNYLASARGAGIVVGGGDIGWVILDIECF